MSPGRAVSTGPTPPDGAASEPPLRASGPPGWLRIAVPALPGDSEIARRAPDIATLDLRTGDGRALAAGRVSIAPGRGVDRLMRFRLRQDAPPGQYSGAVAVGGVTRGIEIDVAEHIALAIRPAPLIIDRAACPSPASAMFENRGNVPLVIDLTGEYPLGEEIQLGAGHALATANTGAHRLADLFAAVLGPTRRPVLRAAGRVQIIMRDGPLALEPGASLTAAFDLAVPDDLSAVARYRCFIPVYDQDLELVIVTATKANF